MSESMFDCAETFRRLGDYLDRELSPDEIAMVKRHLELCKVCASEFRFEEQLLSELKRKAQTSSMPDDVRASVMKALDQARAE
jgi:anti-sigma factor (TIGR02949 family)